MPIVGAAGAATVIEVGVDVFVPPRLSVALAVSTYEPTATFDQDLVKGALLAVATRVLPAKNSTFVIDPPATPGVALALRPIDVGAVKVALFAGAVSVIVGEGVAVTVMLTVLETLIVPRLSVATAVRAYVPA